MKFLQFYRSYPVVTPTHFVAPELHLQQSRSENGYGKYLP
jgi:hypothetical protein